jgi:serine O-acetyltransferase
VIVSAGAKVVGSFTVGDGARVGANSVLLQPVPPGATAVGIPARIIEARADAAREEASARMGFSAYGLTQGDDPVAQAMKGLIDNASSHEHQIALLWQAIEKLSAGARELPSADCVPQDAHTVERFDAEGLNRLVK